MTHNEAIFMCLLKNANRWVPLPEIMRYTKKHCKTECYVVHSRKSDLCNKYGWKGKIFNDSRDGSLYMLKLSEAELSGLRQLWKQTTGKFLPTYSQLQSKLKARQGVLL